jgi:Sulfatase-modifying factor enzyme 1/NACHT domain
MTPLIEKVAAGLLVKVVVAGLTKAFHNNDLARIMDNWRDSFQSPDANEQQLNQAFEDFFSDKLVTDELAKVGRDQYARVNLDILVEQLRARRPAPQGDLHREIESWLLDLKAMFEENPEYRQKYQIGVQDKLPRPEAVIENDSVARKKYIESVVRQHRYIRFSGMAEVGGMAEVEMARIFVTPRVVAQNVERETKKPEPLPADRLVTAKKAASRQVILGGPGTGKTTLLEAIALKFAGGSQLGWAKDVPKLLPVFYRIRDLDQDHKPHTTIWDCIQQQCSRRMGEALPHGFFARQMKAGGLLLLFDGLDEAGSLSRRNDIVDMIGEFSEGLFANSRVIVTSRPHDYRHRFESDSWSHYELCEFDDREIQSFIQGWRAIHEPDQAKAVEKGELLWKALKGRQDILPLARNALLLTMIVRVHFGLGALPDSRLGLYEKCTETLLKHWAEPKGLEPSPIDFTQKRKLLQKLAYQMQGEAEELTDEMALQIPRAELARRFEKFLEEEGCPDVFHLVEKVIHRLHARDAVLVQYGTDQRGQDQFGFVHRSFQEYFAACWMAQELDDAEFQTRLLEDREGWSETLYLAVAHLPDRRRRKTLLELLKIGRAEFAVSCLRAAPPEQPWLQALVRFLSRYTRAGSRYESFPVAECADACAGRAETQDVLQSMFAPENREGQSLAAAVELAEELSGRGDEVARELLNEFFAEAVGQPEDMVEVPAGAFPFEDPAAMVEVAAFQIDRYLVTNQDFERMIPGHPRDKWSDTDRQPVIWVSWHEARLYCRWLGRGCRLPSEQEWEKAAAWDAAAQHKRLYPWGDEFDASLCNTEEGNRGKTSAVGDYPKGRSACGCEDMTGNVWEWIESLGPLEGDMLRIRGGAWTFDRRSATYANRTSTPARSRDSDVGFRCARSLDPGTTAEHSS